MKKFKRTSKTAAIAAFKKWYLGETPDIIKIKVTNFGDLKISMGFWDEESYSYYGENFAIENIKQNVFRVYKLWGDFEEGNVPDHGYEKIWDITSQGDILKTIEGPLSPRKDLLKWKEEPTLPLKEGILNLTPLKINGVIDMSDEDMSEIKNLCRFGVHPNLPGFESRCRAGSIAIIAEKYGYKKALLGEGIPYFLLSNTEKALRGKGISPVYAFKNKKGELNFIEV